MTDKELRAIKERCEDAASGDVSSVGCYYERDVAALLAEIERLRGEVLVRGGTP